MNDKRVSLALALAVAIGACSEREQTAPAEPAADAKTQALPVPPSEPPAVVPTVGGCARSLTPELDRESIVAAFGEAAPSAQALDMFEAQAGAAFKQAAANLCRNGSLAPGLLMSFTTVIIQNGAGATDTAVYEDPHEFRSEDLIFQWTFAEEGLRLPPLADIEKGISCWNDPDQPSCLERQP